MCSSVARREGTIKSAAILFKMRCSCSIVKYHFIRDTVHTKWPEIKACTINNFTKQLDFFGKH